MHITKGLHTLATEIFQLVYSHRRELTHDSASHHQHTIACYSTHINKISQQIEQHQSIEFVLPAFPAKSPNTYKTGSHLPDLGERLSLRFLNRLCEQITRLYSPGAKIIICSDGRVFNDLVNVSDINVSLYAQEINHILREDRLDHLLMYGLDDLFDAVSYESMRDQLVKTYGESIETIQWRVASEENEKLFFNGIHRFIFEDQFALNQTDSKNKIRKQAKSVAYQVIQRSNAWSRLVEMHFPNAIRLSIHPQRCGSKKLGVMLLNSHDQWATPWHRVVLFDGIEHKLIRKKEAETCGAKPVFIKDQFSHYTI